MVFLEIASAILACDIRIFCRFLGPFCTRVDKYCLGAYSPPVIMKNLCVEPRSRKLPGAFLCQNIKEINDMTTYRRDVRVSVVLDPTDLRDIDNLSRLAEDSRSSWCRKILRRAVRDAKAREAEEAEQDGEARR